MNPVGCIFAFVCVFLRLRRLKKMMVRNKKTEDGAKDEMEGRRRSDGGIRQIYTKEGGQLLVVVDRSFREVVMLLTPNGKWVSPD